MGVNLFQYKTFVTRKLIENFIGKFWVLYLIVLNKKELKIQSFNLN